MNFVFYLIGSTKRAIPIISGSLIVSTTSIISLWLLILSFTNFFLLAVPLVKSRELVNHNGGYVLKTEPPYLRDTQRRFPPKNIYWKHFLGFSEYRFDLKRCIISDTVYNLYLLGHSRWNGVFSKLQRLLYYFPENFGRKLTCILRK